MEVNHNKLYNAVKKKIGMSKQVFDCIINAPGDMIEWSIEACLHAASKHDNMVI
jgi:hypothetical protein